MTEASNPHSQDPKSGKHVSSDFMIEQLVSIERVSLNVSQSVIVTTEDKLKLCLQKYVSDAERSKEWIAPLSLLVGLLLSLVAADFRDAWLSASTWQAIFIISAALSLFWFLASLRRAFGNRTIDALINEIKSYSATDGTSRGDENGS
ncbi:hypothetical protein JMK10_02180 [Rhodovulum sulfidophilum]|uniref:hypothetical protein n=1 Tax=Rhodovulum sulfidophilum TaxID=35806 RepID=UPI00192126B5|nr:hypothetical protein [Rhodovulum sulfidophilum]MBL3574286.1 hypothetical protein [Rhodovulum sulfidophilum]MCE8433931.1 hypothetical protein [Rhodovulum sulfidophilum]MCF4115651.1 hypothetical protein [Rhodovulum sulfidophilum]